MCTVILLRRPDHAWPLLLAANRDEMADRAARPPARHWPDREDVVGGIDLLSFGTWLGVNDRGTVAGVLNRPGSLGPAPGLRSRGELPLEALDHADATSAVEALLDLAASSYRAFNLVVADALDAFLVTSGGRKVETVPIPEGLSMVTAQGLNDHRSARAQRFLPLFRAAGVPDPDAGAWGSWIELLSRRDFDADAGPNGAMSIVTDSGFGTVSSSLIAIPAPGSEKRIQWLYADGRPGEALFEPVRA